LAVCRKEILEEEEKNRSMEQSHAVSTNTVIQNDGTLRFCRSVYTHLQDLTTFFVQFLETTVQVCNDFLNKLAFVGGKARH
jgi:hypothetical protein